MPSLPRCEFSMGWVLADKQRRKCHGTRADTKCTGKSSLFRSKFHGWWTWMFHSFGQLNGEFYLCWISSDEWLMVNHGFNIVDDQWIMIRALLRHDATGHKWSTGLPLATSINRHEPSHEHPKFLDLPNAFLILTGLFAQKIVPGVVACWFTAMWCCIDGFEVLRQHWSSQPGWI